MAAALFVTGYNAKYSHCVSMEEFSVLPMLHFIARKFARVSSKVCPGEGSDCFRSTLMIAQLKNSSSVCAVLLDSNI